MSFACPETAGGPPAPPPAAFRGYDLPKRSASYDPSVSPETAADTDLLRRVAGGDREAFGRLFDRHAPGVLGLLVRLVKRRAEAEELLQEVFLQAWRQAATYRPAGASPRSWLLMIARSRAIDRIRAGRSREDRETASARAALLDGHRSDPPVGLARLEGEERRRRVVAALAVLPEEQRRAIELAFFDGLTHREVAERLGQPLGTVKSRILLGMKKLRQELDAQTEALR